MERNLSHRLAYTREISEVFVKHGVTWRWRGLVFEFRFWCW